MNTAYDHPRWLYLLIALAVLVNLTGLPGTILGPDGTLYAAIAKHMAQTNNYVELYSMGQDWLDKPHFPFWMTALSFELFGFSNWAYKLPAVLFLFMGAYYTYLLGTRLYSRIVGSWSCLLLLTAEHIILSNNDVRAEPYLTGLIVAAVYHFYRASITGKYGHIIIGGLMAACTVMTKGIFGLIPIGTAIALPYIIRGEWKQLFHGRWLLAVVLTLLFITPELYCLYAQFDQHPEKVVFGRTNVSGLKFFFWDSQFGRFLNTGPIKGKGDPTFFLHTTLWAFLPWSLLFYVAIVKKFRNNLRMKQQAEWLTIGAIVPTFLIFSLSRFQLPHYIQILFPFFAILVAAHVLELRRETKYVTVIQAVLSVLLLLAVVVIHVLYQPSRVPWTFFLLMALCAAAAWLVWRSGTGFRHLRWMGISAVIILVLNGWLNLVFYPDLLTYQGGSTAAQRLNRSYPGQTVYYFGSTEPFAMEFYLDGKVVPLPSVDSLATYPKPLLAYLSAAQYENLQAKYPNAALLDSLPNYPVSRLGGDFIQPESRRQAVDYHKIIYLR